MCSQIKFVDINQRFSNEHCKGFELKIVNLPFGVCRTGDFSQQGSNRYMPFFLFYTIGSVDMVGGKAFYLSPAFTDESLK